MFFCKCIEIKRSIRKKLNVNPTTDNNNETLSNVLLFLALIAKNKPNGPVN